ncbi:MAG: NAD(P)-dependent oxidoreductase [Anaerovoracaceae bacterium]
MGYGNIGKRVGQIAEAFGMKVYPYSKEPESALSADVISVHCPATAEKHGLHRPRVHLEAQRRRIPDQYRPRITHKRD